MRLDIKTAIWESGWPQYVVAQAIGVSEDRLSKFIHGRGKLSADQMERLKVILQLENLEPSGESKHEPASSQIWVLGRGRDIPRKDQQGRGEAS
jgi:ribosome-binding protein aMBF1 (putative translation factor)